MRRIERPSTASRSNSPSRIPTPIRTARRCPTPTRPAPRQTLVVRASPVEVLRHKDFAQCSDEELDETRRLMDDLHLAGALRRSRRLQPVRHRRAPGTRPDVRSTVRRSVRAGGEAVVPSRRGPGERPRNLVLLLDVSGSMDPYARELVRFAHAAVATRRRGRGRGVRARHPADATDASTELTRSGRGDGRRRGRSRRLVRRHATRRGLAGVQRPVGGARPRPRRRRRDPQ